MKKLLLCLAAVVFCFGSASGCFAQSAREVVTIKDFNVFFSEFIKLKKNEQIACMRFPFILKQSDSMVDVDSQATSLADAKQVLASDIGKGRQIIASKPAKGCSYTSKSTGDNTWDAYLTEGTVTWTAFRFTWDGARWWFYEVSI